MKSTTRKNRSPLMPQFAFYGICLIAVSWLLLLVILETRFGIPTTTIQWAKRIVGWGVEMWLIRSLFLGVRRSLFAMAAK